MANIKRVQAEKPGYTITRVDLEMAMMGKASFEVFKLIEPAVTVNTGDAVGALTDDAVE